MKQILLGTVAAAALLGAVPAAQAGFITFSPSTTTGSVSFTGTGAATGTINESEPAITGNALDSVDGTAVGSWSMGAVSFSTNKPTAANPGVFTAVGTPTATFSYTNGANSVSETITFTDVADGSANPHINWTDKVTAVSGSAAFLAAFGPTGSTSVGDYITNTLPVVGGVQDTLDILALTTRTDTVTLSSGQNVITPTAVGVPEPTSLGMLGTALLLLGLLGWKRYQD